MAVTGSTQDSQLPSAESKSGRALLQAIRQLNSDLHAHHKRAIFAICLAGVMDVLLGIVFALAQRVDVPAGIYFATSTATTAGGDNIVPTSGLARLVTVAIMLTVIPLFAASFSLITSGLTSTHVRQAEDNIKQHVEHATHRVRVAEERIKAHVETVIANGNGNGHGNGHTSDDDDFEEWW